MPFSNITGANYNNITEHSPGYYDSCSYIARNLQFDSFYPDLLGSCHLELLLVAVLSFSGTTQVSIDLICCPKHVVRHVERQWIISHTLL